MAELQPIIVFHGHPFVRHLGICNPIGVKLLQVMSGVIPRNFKKKHVYLKPFSWGPQTWQTHTDRHTHRDTHGDSIRRNAMRCISPKNYLLKTTLISVNMVNIKLLTIWLAWWVNERIQICFITFIFEK